ncbi:MAG: hypothetical protein BWY80_01037 [Firmicutes bacterium ADurb.Bin456]|nr:MAG: hypothetical protein BWY80_01037 [Firmicutes bacterium ADurb.Bin456]
MVQVVVHLRGALGHAPGGDVYLTAQDGLDPGFFAGFVKVHNTIHGTVIGYSKGGHPVFRGPGYGLINPGRPV